MRKFFRWDRLIPAIFALMLSSLIATAATPGVHRSILPKIFGLHQIDEKIYTDNSVEQNKIKRIVENARSDTKRFYGALHSDPQFIICTTERCKKQLGFKSRGIAYGFAHINIGPKGVNETILTHELVHAELHKRMGYIGLLKQTIPAWFNEGLATYLSKDERLTKKYDADDIAWIKRARYRKDWGKYATKDDWKRAYGSAAQAVRNMKAKIGEDGLRQIIKRVTQNGEKFDQVLADLDVL